MNGQGGQHITEIPASWRRSWEEDPWANLLGSESELQAELEKARREAELQAELEKARSPPPPATSLPQCARLLAGRRAATRRPEASDAYEHQLQ